MGKKGRKAQALTLRLSKQGSVVYKIPKERGVCWIVALLSV